MSPQVKTLDTRELEPEQSASRCVVLDLLSYIYQENDRPEKAAILLAALEELGLGNTRLRVALALAHLKSGKPITALDVLDRAAMRGNINAAFHLVRAQTLVALDRPAEAAAAMRAYISMRTSTTPPSPDATS